LCHSFTSGKNDALSDYWFAGTFQYELFSNISQKKYRFDVTCMMHKVASQSVLKFTPVLPDFRTEFPFTFVEPTPGLFIIPNEYIFHLNEINAVSTVDNVIEVDIENLQVKTVKRIVSQRLPPVLNVSECWIHMLLSHQKVQLERKISAMGLSVAILVSIFTYCDYHTLYTISHTCSELYLALHNDLLLDYDPEWTRYFGSIRVVFDGSQIWKQITYKNFVKNNAELITYLRNSYEEEIVLWRKIADMLHFSGAIVNGLRCYIDCNNDDIISIDHIDKLTECKMKVHNVTNKEVTVGFGASSSTICPHYFPMHVIPLVFHNRMGLSPRTPDKVKHAGWFEMFTMGADRRVIARKFYSPSLHNLTAVPLGRRMNPQTFKKYTVSNEVEGNMVHATIPAMSSISADIRPQERSIDSCKKFIKNQSLVMVFMQSRTKKEVYDEFFQDDNVWRGVLRSNALVVFANK
jgi:hypothetical protein